jgi:hypothetical protein
LLVQMSLLETNPDSLVSLSDSDLVGLAQQILSIQDQDRQANQLRYYQPASLIAGRVHTSTAKTLGIGGGNGAGKTDHALAEMIIRATGQIPLSQLDTYPRQKLRGPIACRVVCESLTTVLVPTILPKLQWWRWSGVGQPGSSQGHWGWIPKHCLIGGEWKKSWSERLRILRFYYCDTNDPTKIRGESSIQFMSYDQDSTDFASGDFHFILHDEPPKYDIWRENRARVMRADGTMVVAMTWPDDPAIPIDWLFDEVYDKGQPGPAKDPEIDWLNIFTTDNPHLNQTAVSMRAGQMSEAERQVRLYGQPLRFSNRIHPDFTDQPRTWCLECGKDVIAVQGKCSICTNDVTIYTHVLNGRADKLYPVIFALDPHPRKPHMGLWLQIDTNDDLYVVDEISIPGGPEDVRDAVAQVEDRYGWTRIQRLIDPNMGRSPSSPIRDRTWQDEFRDVGLVFDLADDSDVGRAAINEYLKPDKQTGSPRLTCDCRVATTIKQMKRYSWADFRHSLEHDLKQVPRSKDDDMPTLLKYCLNSRPTFRGLVDQGRPLRRVGNRQNGY